MFDNGFQNAVGDHSEQAAAVASWFTTTTHGDDVQIFAVGIMLALMSDEADWQLGVAGELLGGELLRDGEPVGDDTWAGVEIETTVETTVVWSHGTMKIRRMDSIRLFIGAGMHMCKYILPGGGCCWCGFFILRMPCSHVLSLRLVYQAQVFPAVRQGRPLIDCHDGPL